MGEIKYVMFDVANTLIHKPKVYENIVTVLHKNGTAVPVEKVKYHHKIISELIQFPDRTTKEFYHHFNAELLLSFGINPNEKLLEEIFAACTYLPWETFDDTEAIKKLPVPIGVLSNFKSDLGKLLENLIGSVFQDIINSEEVGVQKPNPKIFNFAIDKTGLAPGNILFIGDSPRLDIIPAVKLGMKAKLIDRLGIYSNSEYSITSLNEIGRFI